MKKCSSFRRPVAARLIAVAIAVTFTAGVCWPQKKNKNDQADTSQSSTAAQMLTTGPDTQQIDTAIGEMLAGFQLGDVELMHKHYADNASFVSGAYEPPVIGWQNYLPIYQRQRSGFQDVQLIRRNTFIFVHGDMAWASYQWDFDGSFNERPYSARGQTTLVLSKVGQNWLIVHNHTSQICPENATSPAQPQAKP